MISLLLEGVAKITKLVANPSLPEAEPCQQRRQAFINAVAQARELATLEERQWIDGDVALLLIAPPYLEVKMRPACAACLSDAGHLLAALYSRALAHKQPLIMPVYGQQPVVALDNEQISKTTELVSGVCHPSRMRGKNPSSFRRRDVESVVK
jgi:hypothetical protein